MSRSLSRQAEELRFRLKTFLGTRPGLYFALYRFKQGHSDLLVDRNTDICIEGFPRSANSFTVSAISTAQSERIKISHHTHVSANAIRSCTLGIPTLILVRNPLDAITSLTALRLQTRNMSPHEARESGTISLTLQANAWIAFYESLLPYRNQFVIAPFPSVINDLGPVIERLNDTFKIDLNVFDHTRANVESLHEERGYHAGPNEQRGAIKDAVRAVFEHQIDSDSAVRARMRDAQDLYHRWIEMSSF